MCLVRNFSSADVPGMKNKSTASLAIAVLTLCLALPAVAAANVTICHAAGHADTTQFVTLTIPEQALSAHFDDHGTPAAGHEQDYFGECEGDTETPDTTTTTTAVSETFTETDTESTTNETGTTPTTLPYDEIGSLVLGLTVTASVPSEDPSSTSGLTIAARETAQSPVAAPVLAITELPFTGASTGSLAILAFGFVAAGLCLLNLQRSSGDEIIVGSTD